MPFSAVNTSRSTLSDIIECSTLSQVRDTLGKYSDLMDGFDEFLAHSEKTGNNVKNLLARPSCISSAFL